MTEPAPTDDLPVMRIDSARLESWTRLATEISLIVKDARKDMGRKAFSEAEEKALDHDQSELSAIEPSVRPLTPDETQQWRQRGQHDAEQRTTTDAAAEHGLRVRVGPMSNQRWAMDADIHRLDPDGRPIGDPVTSVTVSCATEKTAREVADELLSTGADPDAVTRIATHTTDRAARQAAAAPEVTESVPARMTRTREAIRAVWRPELAERVLASSGFDALATRLHQLEERGATMTDVLGRLSQRSLLAPTVRDPARLAAWMCDSLLTVIDGEVITTPTQTPTTAQTTAQTTASATPRPSPSPRPSPRPRPRDAGDGSPAGAAAQEAAPPAGSVERDWQRAVAEDTVWPALRAALPEQLCHTLRGSPGYERLVTDLAAKTGAGWSPQELLARLPTEKISQADDPARYLSGVLANRAQHSPPPRTGVNKHAMATVVREAFPPELATQVLRCPAWPALANRMAHAEATIRPGDPSLTEMLRAMPADPIGAARKPAAYTAELLHRHVAARHGEPLPPRASAHPGTTARPLDPASAIDRIALDDAAPVTDQQPQTSLDEAGKVGPESGAAAHRQAADDATRDADRDERGAGYERSDPDAALGNRVGVGGYDAVGLATLDDNLAAGARATAAEETDAAVAAVLRAETLLTPPSNTTAGQQPRQPRGDIQPVRVPAQTLTQGRKRSR